MYEFRKKRYACVNTRVYLFLLRGDRMSEWVITTAITLGIGVITYFLKRTMNQVDRQDSRIQQQENTAVTRTELEKNMDKLEQDIRQIRDDYTPKEMHRKDFDECRADIKQIRADFMTKEDFIREISKLDRKLDRMLEMMINRQGNGG